MIYRHAVGGAELISLNMASVSRSLDELIQLFPNVGREMLADAIAPDTEADWSYNLSLVRVGYANVLIDTGYSFEPGGPGACTRDLLSEAGLAEEDVDIVVLTHGHGDHVGGLIREGVPAFSRAELVLSEAEERFWTGDAGVSARGEEAALAVRRALAAYAGRIRLLESADDVVSNDGGVLRSIPLSGHTPGHIGLELESDGQSIWILVDVVHAPFQLADLSWSPRFDSDPVDAAATRKEILARAVSDGCEIHLYHFPFPGIGHVEERDNALGWRPIAGA